MKQIFIGVIGLVCIQSALAERTCRLLFFKRPVQAPAKVFMNSGKGSQLVDLPRMDFSKHYKLPPGDLKILFSENEIKDRNKIPNNTAFVSIPESWSQVYLLFSYAAENKGAAFRVKAINASAANFKIGDALWVNMTNHKVIGLLAKSKMVLSARSMRVVKSPLAKKGDYSVMINYLSNGEKKYRPLCRTTWHHDGRSRWVRFVIPERGRKAPRIMSVQDAPLLEEAE